jgi:hypothetical protein
MKKFHIGLKNFYKNMDKIMYRASKPLRSLIWLSPLADEHIQKAADRNKELTSFVMVNPLRQIIKQRQSKAK